MVPAIIMVTVIPQVLIRVFLPSQGVVEAIEVLTEVHFVHVVQRVRPSELHGKLPLPVGKVARERHLARDTTPVLVLGVREGVLELLAEAPGLGGEEEREGCQVGMYRDEIKGGREKRRGRCNQVEMYI